MSKIEDFYQLRDQYREMFSDDADEELWKVKEKTFLRDELATVIRDSVAQVLSEGKRLRVYTLHNSKKNSNS